MVAAAAAGRGDGVVLPAAAHRARVGHTAAAAETGSTVPEATSTAQAGALRKGGDVVLDGRPCRIVELIASKSPRTIWVKGVDLFTGKPYSGEWPADTTVDVPDVTWEVFDVVGSEDGVLRLRAGDGTAKDDVPLSGPLVADIKEVLAEGKKISVSVTTAMGEQQVTSLRD